MRPPFRHGGKTCAVRPPLMPGVVGSRPLSALTRRSAGLPRRTANSAPARRCVWPAAAPAGALVRAGAGLRGVGQEKTVSPEGFVLPCVQPPSDHHLSFHVRCRRRQRRGCFLRLPRSVFVHACLAVLLPRSAFVHACLFSFVRKKETACGMFRSCSARSESPVVGSLAF